jgi:hypothetical protein
VTVVFTKANSIKKNSIHPRTGSPTNTVSMFSAINISTRINLRISLSNPSVATVACVAVNLVHTGPAVQAQRRCALVDLVPAAGALPPGLALAVEPARPACLRLLARLVRRPVGGSVQTPPF